MARARAAVWVCAVATLTPRVRPPRASVAVAGGAAVVAGLGGASEVALVLGEEDGAAPRRARRSDRSPHGSQSYDISIINLIGSMHNASMAQVAHVCETSELRLVYSNLSVYACSEGS